MKDILQDIVAHTHALGFLALVKVNSENGSTTIDSMAEDRSVILTASTHKPVAEFIGTFGMPNLDKLSLHLKNPEYKDKAKIEVKSAESSRRKTMCCKKRLAASTFSILRELKSFKQRLSSKLIPSYIKSYLAKSTAIRY